MADARGGPGIDPTRSTAPPGAAADRDRLGSGSDRAPGWREVLLVGVAVVLVVFAAIALTAALPADAQSLVFHTPLAIVVLIVGTVLVLVRIATRPPRA